ncbi:uncharacterized protein LOC127524515 isoform X3 [Ctenopharyngodon idella]|uniref:uncharacterized protein LOC127524515 isoform X3 n=1 Tax=Ctenopharyngodon idella TaxID=7959 RepID=UPI002231510E|nr:uncharacterized protein LOC127524515 isoform X3 [Ctenopharyngodon idella]
MSVRNMIKPAMLNKDEDEEVIVRKRMKKTKTSEDYVEGSDLSEATAEGEDKEERKGDASPEIPVFPTPPIKMSKNVCLGSPRSVGQEKLTSRTSRTVGRASSTSGSSRSRSRSVDRDSSSSCSSRSVSRDSSSSRVPRSQAVESRSIDGLSHARSISNRDVPTTFPLSEAKFQKIVLTKLVTLTDEVRKLQRSGPQSGIEIKKMDTLEEFQRAEASLLKPHKFETLVCQLARVGGRDVKDCTHKVMDRLFTNQLMTRFNMKGKSKKDKIRFEDETLFSAIKAAVMKWDAAATETQIKSAAADHLKHAPGRLGGGGY